MFPSKIPPKVCELVDLWCITQILFQPLSGISIIAALSNFSFEILDNFTSLALSQLLKWNLLRS